MRKFNMNFSLLFEIINAAMIGLITGSFLGAFPFGFGMYGALVGGGVGAVFLTSFILLLRFKKWETAKLIVKYGSIGVLPGVLIGGSKIIGLGITGALTFGLISAIIYGTAVYKLVDYHSKSEKYILYPGHYAVLFLLGSISVFITILVVGFLTNILDLEALILELPFMLIVSLMTGIFIFIYIISFLVKKRKYVTWTHAFKKSLFTLGFLLGLIVLIFAAIGFTRSGYFPLNTMIYIVAGFVIPYTIGLGLPLSLGYLMAFNTNRPVMGSIFCIVGSGFVIFIGIQVAPMLLLPNSGLMWAGLITGLFMLMFGLSALFKPETHFFAGTSIIIFSILSFLGAAGGLIIGGLLGLAGGILIASWDGLEKTVNHDRNENTSNSSSSIPTVPTDTVSS
ncbi:DUF6114 domain-containing protein [Pueribacillus sp. YX66]|uniref:DUF6114 domain-containing protein n=1 Tax=Pueribacillus sp. YX66 TaxID=3229242 RepID=UPI00358D224C